LIVYDRSTVGSGAWSTRTNRASMTANEPLDPLIEEATDWLLRLEEDSGDAGLRAAAEAWRQADPAHARAWIHAERAWHLLPTRWPQSAVAHQDSRAVASASRFARVPAPARWAVGIAAALMAFFAVMYLPATLTRLQADFATETAELRQITLEDGTVVHLGPLTALDVLFTADRRSVTLLAGEAFFEVTPDRARPFEVQARELAVTVVGTAFDVRISDDALSVGVQHGVVEARAGYAASPSPVRLGPGDRFVVDRRSGYVRRTKVPPGEVASWRDRKLFVEGATVAEVVDELRRYRSGWIVFAGGGLADQRITGFYDLQDPDAALRILVGPLGGRVREVTPLLQVISGP
jgi:transmembrane sensor